MSCPLFAFDRVRSPPSLFRWMYWHCAVAVSAFGIAAFAKTRVDSLVDCPTPGYIDFYLWFRLILGCLQIPAHLLILNRYRLSEFNENAPKLILQRLNPARFYQSIIVCNVALCVMLMLGLAYVIGVSACKSGPQNVLYGLEAASLFVWTMVLLPRWTAMALQKTQQWYYLRWSDSIQQRYVDSFNPHLKKDLTDIEIQPKIIQPKEKVPDEPIASAPVLTTDEPQREGASSVSSSAENSAPVSPRLHDETGQQQVMIPEVDDKNDKKELTLTPIIP